jgi:predicted transcriptional regulator
MKPRPGKYADWRHPETGELYSVLEAYAVTMRKQRWTIARIAKTLGVSRTCVGRWVKGTKANAAAIAAQRPGGAYPPGMSNFARKLHKQGYSRLERVLICRNVAAREQGAKL